MACFALRPLTLSDEAPLAALRAYIETLTRPTAADYELLRARLVVGHYGRGELVLAAGQRCEHVFFVAEGLTRHYHDDRGEEGTVWFSGAGEVLTEPTSFWGRQPSPSSIIAVVETKLVGLAHPQLHELYELSPAWERLGRRVAEQYVLRLSERAFLFQFKSARQRFDELLRQQPGLFQQVPLVHIASYLGIAPETLSRLRAEG